MKKQMYSIYDVKSEFYGTPVLFHSEEDAKRGFASLLSNPNTKSMYADYPEDYRIFQIGTFNDNNGSLDTLKTPKLICELVSLQRTPAQTLPKLTEGGD